MKFLYHKLTIGTNVKNMFFAMNCFPDIESAKLHSFLLFVVWMRTAISLVRVAPSLVIAN